ncbi:MAG: transcription elongation factor GreA [Opitutales bacterium]|nr:transcription elongation factor GreA [Opitutales bacterium]NRA26011.1 transcription elongation factor GreA [Opitutales bacterium]
MNEAVIDILIQKKPKLKSARAKLASMQPGSYCLHRSWGFGHISDYDGENNRLIIDFTEEGKEGHSMDPAFCVDKLEILAENDLLVIKHTNPAEINRMIKEEPVAMIVNILESNESLSATAAEIERVLARVIGPIKYKKWWTATKKLLAKDPRIGVPVKKTEPYVLRDEPIRPEVEILEKYRNTKNAKQKILFADELFVMSDGKPELKDDLPDVLDDLTQTIQEAKSLTMADRLYGVWVRNNLARDLHEDVESLIPTSGSILEATDDLSQLAVDLPHQYYKRYLDLISRTFPERWVEILEELLFNSEGKFTNECINFLFEREKQDVVSDCFQRWLNDKSIKAPILFWIIKNRPARKYSRMIDPLLDPSFLKCVFDAIDNEALQMTGSRRIPLAELVNEDSTLIADLLQSASLEESRDLGQTLLMNQGFEELTKKSIFARFIKVHGSLQSLISQEVETREQDLLIVSKDSFERAKSELEEIIQVKIPENKEAIATAREHGDLKENSEYKMARQDQDTLLARKSQLESDLNKARVTDFTEATDTTISVGTTVTLTEGSTGREITYSLLGAWDSDPDKNILSYKTPLGKALLSKKVGESASTQIDGESEEWTIQKIKRWVDTAGK